MVGSALVDSQHWKQNEGYVKWASERLEGGG